MAEGSQRPERADHSDEFPNDGEDTALEQLRELILGGERRGLAELEQRLSHPETRAREVGAILASAIEQAAEEDEEGLSGALFRPVEKALRRSTQDDPQALADALFPVMGPAIRRAIVETVRGMIESTNRAIENSLSWDGLKWRIEALWTGKSFGEIALTRGLVFRVEQLLLIHRQTGLLLKQVAPPDIHAQDADMVSGMLTAIRDFVSDSFGATPGESVNSMRVGELEVIVQDGPGAVLAAVVRGNPPHELTVALQEALEKIHGRFAAGLAGFEGDSSTFEESGQLLEPCLWSQHRAARKNPVRLWLVRAVVVLLLLAGVVWVAQGWIESRRWSRALSLLENSPGVAVTTVHREQGIRVVRGLRDPDAESPAEILTGAGIRSDDFRLHLEPYQSLEPTLVKRRLDRLLETPSTVTTTLRQGILVAEGTAPADWLSGARRRLDSSLLIEDYDLTGVTALLPPEVMATLQRIHQLEVFMETGTTRIRPESADVPERLSGLIDQLLDLVAPDVRTVTIEVIGHTDRSGTEASNLALSIRRAERIRDLLMEKGVPAGLLRVRGMGSRRFRGAVDDETARQRSRRVNLRVEVGSAGETSAGVADDGNDAEHDEQAGNDQDQVGEAQSQ